MAAAANRVRWPHSAIGGFGHHKKIRETRGDGLECWNGRGNLTIPVEIVKESVFKVSLPSVKLCTDISDFNHLPLE